MHAAAELTAAQLLKLELVLATDERASKDEQVIQVDVRVCPGEVRRTGEKCRLALAGRLALVV